MTIEVVAVVVNWNDREATLACLESLCGSAPLRPTIILVDNGSSDGTVTSVEDAFPQVEIVALPANRHFAAGANAGLRRGLQLGADYLWLLNNDVTVAPDALAEMVRLAQADPGVGVVGPRVRTPAGTDEMGAWWDLTAARITPAFTRHVPPGATTLTVDYIWGCAMLVRASVLRHVGLLDERYIAYFEDADFCLRAARAGYRVVASTNSLIWHAGSLTASRRPLWQTWRRAVGRMRFFWRYGRASHRPMLVARTIVREWPLLVAGMVRRHYNSHQEETWSD